MHFREIKMQSQSPRPTFQEEGILHISSGMLLWYEKGIEIPEG